jgi:hypothetical protein
VGARGAEADEDPGLYLRENLNTGRCHGDDRRFDSLWEAAGALGLPVLIHTSDPDAFFTPIDRFNERTSPAALARVVFSRKATFQPTAPSKRHATACWRATPHALPPAPLRQLRQFGNMEEVLTRYSNTTVEFGACISEPGCQRA